MSNTVLLVAAYALIWAVVFGYVIWMVTRQEKLRREIEALQGALENRAGREVRRA